MVHSLYSDALFRWFKSSKRSLDERKTLTPPPVSQTKNNGKMLIFGFSFFHLYMVFYIASRACISVPASLVTRRAELSSKSNTVAGALSPKIGQRMGVTSHLKLALEVTIRPYT